MWPNSQETADLVTFTEESPHGKHGMEIWNLKFEVFTGKLSAQNQQKIH